MIENSLVLNRPPPALERESMGVNQTTIKKELPIATNREGADPDPATRCGNPLHLCFEALGGRRIHFSLLIRGHQRRSARKLVGPTL